MQNAALAVVSGVLMVLAFPKFGLFPLAWISLIPLIVAVNRARWLGSFGLGVITGFVFFGGLLYWISLFGYLPWFLLALVQSLSVGIFALLINVIGKCGLITLAAVPSLWTALEWIRSLGAFGFTWGDLAYSQAGWLHIIQISNITGPWGVTFLIVLVNTALALLLIQRDKVALVQASAVAGLVVIAAVAGVVTLNNIESDIIPDKKVALVQGGVEMTWRDEKVLEEIRQTYWPMTKNLPRNLDLIVWPESALPGYLLSSEWLRQEMAHLARENKAYMLVGGPHVIEDDNTEAGYKEQNGAYLIHPSGELAGEYYKVHLVPFGEFVPGRDWLPLLQNYKIREVDYSPGQGHNTLHSSHGSIGVAICFESIFPGISTKFTQAGAGLLVVITNDSWFGMTAAPAQHHDFSVFRAVENRRYVLRNASTGISSIISPTGRVLSSAELGEKAVVKGEVAMLTGETIYMRFGDWFAVLCSIAGMILLFISLRPYKTMGHPR